MGPTMKDRMMSNRWFKSAAALLFTLALSVPLCAAAGPQKTFATPEIAVEALVDSLARNDDAELRAILGLNYERLMSLDDLSAEDRLAFLAAWAKGHRILRDSDSVAHLEVSSGWTLPIPVVRNASGWVFDTRAGKEEMRTRRIGRNELAAIETMYAYVDAQQEYAEQDRNGDGILEFAQKILSSPGKQDGLSWPTAADEPESPAGPLLETKDLKDGYHGYRFRILKAQGGGRKRRCAQLCQRRPHDRWLRAGCLAGPLWRDRRDDLHRQSGRCRVPEAPWPQFRLYCRRDDPF